MGRSRSEKGSGEIVKIDHTGALATKKATSSGGTSGIRARGNLQGTRLEMLAGALRDLGHLEKASAPA
jgi:hypothetical protein